ncbi:MAG: hypothetical protein ABI813_04710 [Bacteroidota bacterium]
MIITHPFLFNTIVVLFITFTTAWVVYLISHKKSLGLKSRIKELGNQEEQARRQILPLEEQRERHPAYPLNSGSVIVLSSRIRKAN